MVMHNLTKHKRRTRAMSEEQTEQPAHDHTNRIGASRAPAILGLDPYCTPYEAWLEIKGEPKNATALAEAAHWGVVNEANVVTHGYEPRTGKQTQRVNRRLRHPEHSYITASLDRRVIPASDKRIVQVKTRDRFVRDQWGTPGTDEVPDKEATQVITEIEVANAVFPDGVDVEDVAVLFGGNTFELYHVHREPDNGKRLIEALAHWWHVHIDGDTPPDAVTVDDCRRRWSYTSGDHRDMTQEDKQLLERFLAAEFLGKKAEADKEAAKLALMKNMQNSEALIVDGKPVITWKTQTQFDQDVFLERYPEVAAKCIKFDSALARKEYAKLYSGCKTLEKRGAFRVNRSAASKLLNN